MRRNVTMTTALSKKTGTPVHMVGLEGVGKSLLLDSEQLRDLIRQAEGALLNDRTAD